MSLINTNKNYLRTMGIAEDDPQVGVIVSVYYLGCAFGAVLFSWLSDQYGRKPSLFGCLATASLGNLIMFVSGLGYSRGALAVMYLGRVVMGLGVGGIDSVVPLYSSELSSDDARGKALAQEFQSNIFGLNMAFAINLGITVALTKWNQWAWRVPIIAMQVYPVGLMILINILPESPRWYVFHDRQEDAEKSLQTILGPEDGKKKCEELVESSNAERDENVTYMDMFTPGHPQFHPTVITVMGQVNQALTGYGGTYTIQILVMRYCQLHYSQLTSCLGLWPSNIRALRLPRTRVRILNSRELHLILPPDDVRVATHRRRWSPDSPARRICSPECQFLPACTVWWSSYESQPHRPTC